MAPGNLRDRIHRALNLDDELVTRTCRATPDPSASPRTVHEEDAVEDYDRQFLKRFAFNTTAIEGSTLDFRDTECVIEGVTPPNMEDKEIRDVYAAKGAKEGFELAMDRLGEGVPVSEELVKDIHQITAQDCALRTRGVYRLTPVYITNSLTVPANPDQVRDLMATLVYAYENSSMHPIARAAAFHAMFENIHPFRDGNGRTGRIVMNYMLMENGYPPIAIRASGRVEYMRALEDWQVRDDPEALLALVNSNVEEEITSRRGAIELTRAAVSKVLFLEQ